MRIAHRRHYHAVTGSTARNAVYTRSRRPPTSRGTRFPVAAIISRILSAQHGASTSVLLPPPSAPLSLFRPSRLFKRRFHFRIKFIFGAWYARIAFQSRQGHKCPQPIALIIDPIGLCITRTRICTLPLCTPRAALKLVASEPMDITLWRSKRDDLGTIANTQNRAGAAFQRPLLCYIFRFYEFHGFFPDFCKSFHPSFQSIWKT